MIKRLRVPLTVSVMVFLIHVRNPHPIRGQNVLIVMSALMLGSMAEGAMGSRVVMYS